VLWGLELVDRVPKARPAVRRMGMGTGPVILQGGDYFGWTVNVAARITDHARAWQVLSQRPW
jgi:class 3 adenylate cyclase